MEAPGSPETAPVKAEIGENATFLEQLRRKCGCYPGMLDPDAPKPLKRADIGPNSRFKTRTDVFRSMKPGDRYLFEAFDGNDRASVRGAAGALNRTGRIRDRVFRSRKICGHLIEIRCIRKL